MSQLQPSDPNPWALYEEALRYKEAGDVYHAVKLLKKVIRLYPEEPKAFAALGLIYTERKEWKPAFHYWKKTIALDTDYREAWWQLGLAATALGRNRVAQSVWNKFGLNKIKSDHPFGLEVRLKEGYEILWMLPLDNAQCRLMSIPHPGSGMRYRDLVLYDRRNRCGTHIANQRRVPIFRYVDKLKRSPYQTFSCLIHTDQESDIQRLQQICADNGLGFEVWSNAIRAMRINPEGTGEVERTNFPEYYADLLKNTNNGVTLVAMAAVHPAEVEHILNAWHLVCLVDYSDLRHY